MLKTNKNNVPNDAFFETISCGVVVVPEQSKRQKNYIEYIYVYYYIFSKRMQSLRDIQYILKNTV